MDGGPQSAAGVNSDVVTRIRVGFDTPSPDRIAYNRLCRGGDGRLQLMFHNQEDLTMRRFIGSASIALLALLVSGCARPWELGWTPAYTADERGNQILRNW